MPQDRTRPPRPPAAGLPAEPPPGAPPPAPSPGQIERDRLRENLRPVLAGLRWPASRWEILAEADAWGVSGVVRNQLVPLPDGRYPSVEAVVEVLSGRGRLRSAPPAAGPERGLPGSRVDPRSRNVVPAHRPTVVRRTPRPGS